MDLTLFVFIIPNSLKQIQERSQSESRHFFIFSHFISIINAVPISYSKLDKFKSFFEEKEQKKSVFPELEKGQKNFNCDLRSIFSFNQFSCCCFYFCFIDEVKFTKSEKMKNLNLLNSETNFHRFSLAIQKT